MKLSILCCLGLLIMLPAAHAQALETGRSVDDAALLNEHNLTGTGATVPHPGVPQGSGVTPLDRGIEHRDDQIDNSICRGC